MIGAHSVQQCFKNVKYCLIYWQINIIYRCKHGKCTYCTAKSLRIATLLETLVYTKYAAMYTWLVHMLQSSVSTNKTIVGHPGVPAIIEDEFVAKVQRLLWCSIQLYLCKHCVLKIQTRGTILNLSICIHPKLESHSNFTNRTFLHGLKMVCGLWLSAHHSGPKSSLRVVKTNAF